MIRALGSEMCEALGSIASHAPLQLSLIATAMAQLTLPTFNPLSTPTFSIQPPPPPESLEKIWRSLHPVRLSHIHPGPESIPLDGKSVNFEEIKISSHSQVINMAYKQESDSLSPQALTYHTCIYFVTWTLLTAHDSSN